MHERSNLNRTALGLISGVEATSVRFSTVAPLEGARSQPPKGPSQKGRAVPTV